MEQDFKHLVRERILKKDELIRATFSGEQKGSSLPWNRVVVRPVEVQGKIHLQFSYFDDKKDITKNYLEDAASKVDELLALPFRNIFVESAAGGFQVNISKKGKAILSEAKQPKTTEAANLAHDRHKNRLLSTENGEPFLQAIGMMTNDGRIRADMQHKFKQINEFLRLVEETRAIQALSGQPIHIVDFGCGSAHLTFAIYYYLREVLKLDVYVTGVDVKADLIERHKEKVKSMGWDELTFQAGRIADYEPETIPNVVLALHACDTATDDALAQGIRWDSKLIVCAPCCQHELQEQMSRIALPNQLASIFKDGIFFERMGDILTDTFRANILRIMGYHTDVTEFVPIDHTAKNLMIRSVKTSSAGNAHWMEEYRNLKSFWQVTPYLERLLGDQFAQFL